MAFVLIPVLCLLSGAYAQEWGVTFTSNPLAGWVNSCVTIPCSFSYPTAENITTVIWTLNRDKTVYHSDKGLIHADFKGRALYLGDMQKNCSLRLVGLRLSDKGNYHFRFETRRDGNRNGWTSKSGLFLHLFDSPCQPSLWHKGKPERSLTCFVRATCPLRLSWYDANGTRQIQEQTPAGAGVTELTTSPSQLPSGVALICHGYWDECDSNQSQPLSPDAPNKPSVKVLKTTGKTAIKEGDEFTLSCQAGALDHVAGYVWSRGDVWLPGTEQNFRIDKANISDGGNYSCGVWVSHPHRAYLSLSARETVKVQDAPKGVNIIAMPRADLCEGDTVTLTCHFSSSVLAAVTYTWYKDNASVEESQPKLVLQGVTATHTGEYRCEVQNQVGTARSPPRAITIPACSRCQYWSPGLVAGILGAILVLVILVNIGACYLLRRRWQQVGADQAAKGVELSHGQPQIESIYENISG